MSDLSKRWCRLVLSAGLLCFAWAMARPVRADSTDGIFEDVRIRRWATEQSAGRTAACIVAIEQDLASDSPHPIAGYLWIRLQELRVDKEDVPGVWAALPRGRARDRLERVVRMYVGLESTDPSQGELDLPDGTIDSTDDVSSLIFAAYAVSANYERRLRLLDRIAQLTRGTFAFSAIERADVERKYRAPSQAVETSSETPAALAGTPLEPLLRAIRASHGGVLADLRAYEAYLQVRPRDPWAQRKRAELLEGLARYGEAADVRAELRRWWPFFTWSLPDEARDLVRLGRMEEARRLVEHWNRVYGRASGRDSSAFHGRFAEVLRSAGERGLARAEIAPLVQADVADPYVHWVMASLEVDSGRASHAVAPARRAFLLDPDSVEYANTLVDTLRQAGRGTEIEAVLAAFRRADRPPTALMLNDAVWSAIDRGAFQEALALADEERTSHPTTTHAYADHAAALWRVGRREEALAEIKSIVERERYDWGVDRLVEWTRELEGDGAVLDRLRALADLDPRDSHIWAAWADRFPGGTGRDRRLEVYRQAFVASPRWFWAATKVLEELVLADRFDEALAFLEEQLAGGPDATYRVELLNDLAWLSHTATAHRRADRALLERGLEATREMERLGDAPSRYLYHRPRILAALHLPVEAAEAALQYAAASPDDSDPVTGIFNGHLDEAGSRAWSALDRYVARNPYSGTRLAKAAHFHARWGGSPIIALRYQAWIRERAPESSNTDIEGTAWGALGDHVRGYAQYQGATAVSKSDRYIGWFDSARASALQASSRASLSFEPSTANRCPIGNLRPRLSSPDAPYAILCDDAGNVMVREDDPVTGRPVLLQRGNTYVRATYDPVTREVTHIEDSSGTTMDLAYDERGLLQRVSGTNIRTLTLEYDERLRKPTRIDSEGAGSLTVRYRADGSIDQVDSSAGPQVAREVTNAFQQLLAVIRRFQGSAQAHLTLGLHVPDPALEELERDPFGPAGALRLARYLVDHAADDPSHADRAWQMLPEIILGSTQSTLAEGLEGARLYLALARQHRPAGLTEEEMRTYDRVLEVVERSSSSGRLGRVARALLEDVRQHPLRLRDPERWLPRSDLANQGYFRRYPLPDLAPPEIEIARATAVLVRRNGDLVVGTQRGLSVRRRGYFEWFGFDERSGKWRSDPTTTLRASSEVTALAEDEAGRLWIGTANGLLRIDGDYDAETTSYRTDADGLPVPRVDGLAELGPMVAVATGRGLRCTREAMLSPCGGALASEPIVDLSEVPSESGPSQVVVTTPGAVHVMDSEGAVALVTSAAAESAVATQVGGRILLQRGRDLRSVPWPNGGEATAGPLLGAGDVESTHVFHGLSRMTTADGGSAPVVLTDLGLAFYRNRHFEHLRLPLADRVPSVMAVAFRGATGLLSTSDGIYVFERQSVHHFGDSMEDRVTALLTLPTVGVTFLVQSGQVRAIRHDRIEDGPSTLAYASERSPLALAKDGSVLFHDGDFVVAIEPRSGRTRQLFAAPPRNVEQRFSRGEIRGLLAARDGTVWVAAGSAVYHWSGRIGDEPEVFDYFEGPDRFPSMTYQISGLYEGLDGKIRVVGSNEAHIMRNGVSMRGGPLEYVPEENRFQRVTEYDEAPWFVSSYTPMDDRTAIVGTTDGFAVHEKGARLPRAMGDDDASYAALRREQRSLFLGTQGVRLGDVWLFGCASGVVAHRLGTWFYPDRLNWMLPKQQFAQYGSRVVHAVETDPLGRIYVGTDFGLTVYDSGGDTSPAFLVSNGRFVEAVATVSGAQLRRETDALVASLPPHHRLAQRIAEIRAEAQRIEALERRVAEGDGSTVASTAGSSREAPAPNRDVGSAAHDEAERELRRRRQEHSESLLRLERQEPGLFQMLTVPPLDLASVQRDIEPDEVVLQYIPARDRLYIQVLRKDIATLREVEVDTAELMRRARGVALRLAAQYRRPPPPGGGSVGGLRLVRVVTSAEPPIEHELAWLYEYLLRPVESVIGERDHVYVVPAGSLTYLPFSALIRTLEPVPEYAVDRYAFGAISSLYLWQLMHGTTAGHGVRALALADPDGSLPGARLEAAAVQRLAPDSIIKMGPEATYEALEGGASRSQVVLLSTHGVLDGRQPERSFLLLAGGYRLTMADAMVLPLDEVGLVVLSACESGIGAEGLEYATLARSFIHAGASSVVATLWRVPDDSSSALIGRFYQHLVDGDDRMLALARAQRELLHGDDRGARAASAWSGYVLFGRR